MGPQTNVKFNFQRYTFHRSNTWMYAEVGLAIALQYQQHQRA